MLPTDISLIWSALEFLYKGEKVFCHHVFKAWVELDAQIH